jgi:hypothetical protein
MPIIKVKHNTKKFKNTHTKSIYSNKGQTNQQHNLIDLISMISQARKNKTKSQSNLPARLMKMNMDKKSKNYEKSVSSSYSSVMHNGHKHIKGKQVINNSSEPFIKINEMEDGQVHHYMVPKNNIPYKQPTQLEHHFDSEMPMPMPIQIHNQMPMSMQMQMPKSSIVMYSTTIPTITKSKKSKKQKSKKSKKQKSKKSKKSMKPKSKKSKKSKSKK